MVKTQAGAHSPVASMLQAPCLLTAARVFLKGNRSSRVLSTSSVLEAFGDVTPDLMSPFGAPGPCFRQRCPGTRRWRLHLRQVCGVLCSGDNWKGDDFESHETHTRHSRALGARNLGMGTSSRCWPWPRHSALDGAAGLLLPPAQIREVSRHQEVTRVTCVGTAVATHPARPSKAPLTR